MAGPLTDSAVIEGTNNSLAFTTDSYVVDPLFFPGGNIGKLAICGTVNDLAVSGAIPRYIAASFIIEEGFPVDHLNTIAETMAEEAILAEVKIITGDTKVVEKGKCDKLFITTTGIGFINPDFDHIGSGRLIKPGDKLIINGSLGNHSIAIMGARKNLNFQTPILSDCASLNRIIQVVLNNCEEIHFMRDLTRGGLATVLNELADISKSGIFINEDLIPVDEQVKGLCEVLGFDPLYLANEGKVLIVVSSREAEKVLNLLRTDPLGKDAEIIGEITGKIRHVELNTSIGSKRIMDMLTGHQLPRIC